MITKDYNPSTLEVKFARAFSELQEELNKKLPDFEIFQSKENTSIDNPTVEFFIKDQDGDEHEIIVKIIQKPDKR